LTGRTLSDLAVAYGPALLGQAAFARTGARFPLLIKLLDCAQWLSVQVHPNDEQAIGLEGPGHFGKTEAWHVLEAAPNARLIAGVKPGIGIENLAAAIGDDRILDHLYYRDVHAGDTVFMPAGTIHALGPGLLIYEVQQTSDITYRVYDWGRPQTGGRGLHIDKSIAVANPNADTPPLPPPTLADGDLATLVHCPYFQLDLAVSQTRPLAFDTLGEVFHALTVIEGCAEVVAGEDAVTLGRYETAVVPAACGSYQVRSLGGFRLLRASP
jgi:mannose-6-phosphate isomerase